MRLIPIFLAALFAIVFSYSINTHADQTSAANSNQAFPVQKSSYAPPVQNQSSTTDVNLDDIDKQKKAPNSNILNLNGGSGTNTRSGGAAGTLKHRFTFD
ncbi:hypothetical protein [Polynucleobacter paneuropaeus]|uniref:hypothetical protein n=1 Tax=Polynucleobacter paneuropaeus TaxID=2527775 RepID=UPI001BFDE029|nr:hypothetical protein [Polynucleobacter paneuropaeus]MBT8622985.1 hypothetical protein [Polynucleobacter paneuropaeus]